MDGQTKQPPEILDWPSEALQLTGLITLEIHWALTFPNGPTLNQNSLHTSMSRYKQLTMNGTSQIWYMKARKRPQKLMLEVSKLINKSYSDKTAISIQFFNQAVTLRKSNIKQTNETVKFYLEKISAISKETDVATSTNNIFIIFMTLCTIGLLFFTFKICLHPHTPKSHCFDHTDWGSGLEITCTTSQHLQMSLTITTSSELKRSQTQKTSNYRQLLSRKLQCIPHSRQLVIKAIK